MEGAGLRPSLECVWSGLRLRQRSPIDLPSPGWLGHHAGRQAIRDSGLWNVNFVFDQYDPSSLDVLEAYVRSVPRAEWPSPRAARSGVAQ
jgi:hypothetical protein